MEEILYGKGVTAIEWAERIKDTLPDERVDIILKWVDDKTRTIDIKAFGSHHTGILKKLIHES